MVRWTISGETRSLWRIPDWERQEPIWRFSSGHEEADFTAWLQGLKENGFNAASNSATRDRVITGGSLDRLTDTEDIEVVRRRGIDLGMFTEDDGVILLPNVVGLIEGSPHPEEAGALARWLLSPRGRYGRFFQSPGSSGARNKGGARGTGSEFTG